MTRAIPKTSSSRGSAYFEVVASCVDTKRLLTRHTERQCMRLNSRTTGAPSAPKDCGH